MINVVQSVSTAIAIALFATLLDNFQKTDLAIIVQTATPDSPQILTMISQIQVMLMQAGQTIEVCPPGSRISVVSIFQSAFHYYRISKKFCD